MRQDLTEMVFILDRSGSMAGLEKDTIGGFNSMIEKQKKEVGEAVITTVLFDDEYELLHNGVNIKEIPALTDKEYSARGMTALLDAVGKTINTVGDRLNKTAEYLRPGKVIFVITTDGHENASSEFSASRIKEMVDHQKQKYNWEFIFLGANIDAYGAGGNIGIGGQSVGNYQNTSKGISAMFCSVDTALSSYRTLGKVDENWNANLKSDAEDIK